MIKSFLGLLVLMTSLLGLICEDVIEICETDAEWVVDSEAETILGNSCDIEKIDASNMSSSLFMSMYYQKKPVILQGLTNSWPAMTNWTRSNLLKLYGNRAIKGGSATDIVYGGGLSASKMTLASYVSSFHKETTPDDLFAFDAGFLKTFPELLADFPLPPLLKNGIRISASDSWYMLSLGASRTGLPFHHHGQTWLALVKGKKRWHIYPPGSFAPPSMTVSYDWLHSVWHTSQYFIPLIPASHKPMSFTQLPGEVVYLPKGWKHMTVNIGDAIGVGRQEIYNARDRIGDMTDLRQHLDVGNDVEYHQGLGVGFSHLGIDLQELLSRHDPDSLLPLISDNINMLNSDPMSQMIDNDLTPVNRLLQLALVHFKTAYHLKPSSPDLYCLAAEVCAYLKDNAQAKLIIDDGYRVFQSNLVKSTSSIASKSAAVQKLSRALIINELYQEAMMLINAAIEIDLGNESAKVDKKYIEGKMKE